MSIKLGIAPIAWSNDDMPELGGETTLEQCLSEASKAGFTGIESGGKFPKDSKELIPKLEKPHIRHNRTRSPASSAMIPYYSLQH